MLWILDHDWLLAALAAGVLAALLLLWAVVDVCCRIAGILATLKEQVQYLYAKEKAMSAALDNLTQQVNSTVATEDAAGVTATGLKTQIAGLQTQIADLQNQLGAAAATDQQLDTLRAQLADSENRLKTLMAP